MTFVTFHAGEWGLANIKENIDVHYGSSMQISLSRVKLMSIRLECET